VTLFHVDAVALCHCLIRFYYAVTGVNSLR
jgi:hypothetical protein